MTRALFAITLAVGTPGWAHAAESLAVHVRVTAPAAPTKEAQEQLRQKSEAAQKVYVDLQQALKKQYGKDPEKWPPDQRSECQAAHDAFMEAQRNEAIQPIPGLFEISSQ